MACTPSARSAGALTIAADTTGTLVRFFLILQLQPVHVTRDGRRIALVQIRTLFGGSSGADEDAATPTTSACRCRVVLSLLARCPHLRGGWGWIDAVESLRDFRRGGARRACVRGARSFRVTWVTVKEQDCLARAQSSGATSTTSIRTPQNNGSLVVARVKGQGRPACHRKAHRSGTLETRESAAGTIGRRGKEDGFLSSHVQPPLWSSWARPSWGWSCGSIVAEQRQ